MNASKHEQHNEENMNQYYNTQHNEPTYSNGIYYGGSTTFSPSSSSLPYTYPTPSPTAGRRVIVTQPTQGGYTYVHNMNHMRHVNPHQQYLTYPSHLSSPPSTSYSPLSSPPIDQAMHATSTPSNTYTNAIRYLPAYSNCPTPTHAFNNCLPSTFDYNSRNKHSSFSLLDILKTFLLLFVLLYVLTKIYNDTHTLFTPIPASLDTSSLTLSPTSSLHDLLSEGAWSPDDTTTTIEGQMESEESKTLKSYQKIYMLGLKSMDENISNEEEQQRAKEFARELKILKIRQKKAAELKANKK